MTPTLLYPWARVLSSCMSSIALMYLTQGRESASGGKPSKLPVILMEALGSVSVRRPGPAL